MAAPILAASDLARRFGGVAAIDGFSFTVEAGSAVGLIGPNGAGKTTVFNLISGFDRPDTGTVMLAGRPIHGLPAHRISRLGLGRTFQTVRVFRDLTIEENLRVADSHARPGLDAPYETRAADCLALVELQGRRNDRVGAMSYGQQKLVELAMVLVTQPLIILLDEPVAGVNPLLIEKIAAVLEELRRRGATLLIVEHNVPFVARLCDRVIVMAQGRKLTEGGGAEVQRDPRVLEAFLGG